MLSWQGSKIGVNTGLYIVWTPDPSKLAASPDREERGAWDSPAQTRYRELARAGKDSLQKVTVWSLKKSVRRTVYLCRPCEGKEGHEVAEGALLKSRVYHESAVRAVIKLVWRATFSESDNGTQMMKGPRHRKRSHLCCPFRQPSLQSAPCGPKRPAPSQGWLATRFFKPAFFTCPP